MNLRPAAAMDFADESALPAHGPGAPSLTEIAYRRLEEAIVTLSLRPGAVLTEAQMIDMVGVGRTPVREALIRLAQQGLVEVLPRKGVVVAGINAIDIVSALDAREVLERLIAGDAAKRASPRERIAIVEKARAMREAAASGDANAYMRLDKELDAEVAVAARSPYATRAVEPLQALIRRAWYHFERQDDLMPAASHHVAFAQALATADPAAAMAASDALMLHLRNGLLATLDRE
ncbi:MAG TPA: GntR family transcriptional regulator [Bosea sp. (in: a-proteobacteria)]|jgi:DNA-binding GntR family transcriptional regulator|uniref:GntR family transcriptional regulator n=1 Tax=Bosea sp. (in: a-proteobacteria) TaxID=1871050 RepID=UPI002E155A36|nr:GntR family transcriptional regulator [Bosea sp. (in: a-proteobacteria)]